MDNFSFVFCIFLDKIFPLMFFTFLVFFFPSYNFFLFLKKEKKRKEICLKMIEK